MIFGSDKAHGKGWRTNHNADGLKCSAGGPHHLDMTGDGPCLDCGKMPPPFVQGEEKRGMRRLVHPMRERIAAVTPRPPAFDAKARQSGDA